MSNSASGSKSASTTAVPSFPVRAYSPPPPGTPFPYAPSDFLRQDESQDTNFYSYPKFVTHIDDHAIEVLRQYYDEVLPKQGRILDLCSSWVSHFPKSLEEKAIATKKEIGGGKGNSELGDQHLEITGQGMNAAELKANPILSATVLHDLNSDPKLPLPATSRFNAMVCVVSVDYLTKPLAVLSSLREEHAYPDSTIHLVISNRCFPTKAVGRWLRISESERLQMVADYLHWSGWQDIAIVELCDGKGSNGGWSGMFGGGVDPLWVTRGRKESVRGAEGKE